MSSITFTVPGPPRGKGRPRFTRTGHAYTPEETAAYENLVRLAYQQAARGEKLNGAVSITILATMQIKKSASKKQRKALDETPHTIKPDTDNIIKAVLDGLNGVAFDDDAQVWDIWASKMYGEKPGLEVTLETKKADA